MNSFADQNENDYQWFKMQLVFNVTLFFQWKVFPKSRTNCTLFLSNLISFLLSGLQFIQCAFTWLPKLTRFLFRLWFHCCKWIFGPKSRLGKNVDPYFGCPFKVQFVCKFSSFLTFFSLSFVDILFWSTPGNKIRLRWWWRKKSEFFVHPFPSWQWMNIFLDFFHSKGEVTLIFFLQEETGKEMLDEMITQKWMIQLIKFNCLFAMSKWNWN